MIGWIMGLFHGRNNWTPPDEMVRARMELEAVLRRIEAEINVRRNYNTYSDGKRNRDNLGNNKSSRVQYDAPESSQGDTS